MIGPAQLRSVGVVGTGAIGVSWTVLALEHGLRVVAHDPAPGAEDRLRAGTAALLGDHGADAEVQDRIAFSPDLAGPAATDLVLECGPEDLAVKRAMMAELDETAAPEVLLASSSSGLLPTSFQDACRRHPERVLVAHPFNPPHLVPLVEVVGGELTSEAAVEAAMALMRHLGRQPVRLHRELPGHVANRLQAALWREAYHLVDQGVVSVADLDTVVAAGPGLRWALLGPLATQHLSGGDGGLDHVLRHLGPPMVAWWEDLGHPELTPELVERLVSGVDDELGDTTTTELRSCRDAALRELLALKTRAGL